MKTTTALVLLTALCLPAVGRPQEAPVEAAWIGTTISSYPEGLGTKDSVLVDLDGDGALDLASVSTPVNPRLSVLFGDGLGTLGAATQYVLDSGSNSIVAGDVDGDGDADLLVADSGYGGLQSFSVLVNDGLGGFGAPVHYPLGSFPYGMDLADVDGDGDPDLLATTAGGLMLALGTTGSAFLAPQVLFLPSGARDVAAGDLDGDGDADLVVAHTSKQVSVLLNIGIGFGPAVQLQGPAAGFFNDDANVELGDVDLDGDLDVLYSSESMGSAAGGPGHGVLALYRNPGAGVFGAAETVPLSPLGKGGGDLEVADVTGDGWPDVVTPNGSSTWVLLPGDGAGGFAAAQQYGTGGGAVACDLGDLDGDGALDVVLTAGSTMEACVHRNLGGGAFFQPAPVEMIPAAGAPASSSRLEAVDLDLDGDLDLVVGYSENFNGVYGLSVRRNDGQGGFLPADDYPSAGFPEWITVGDVDNDGDPDLVWLDGWGTFNAKVHYRPNLAALGVFGPEVTLPGTLCEQDARILLHDVDADGRQDVLVYTCYDTVYTYLGQGGGTFAAPLSKKVSGGGGALAVGDFDGDGLADIATNSGVQGYVEVHKGAGDGTWSTPVTYTTGRGVESLAVGDLDGDGREDLVAAYTLDGGGVSVLLGIAGGLAPGVQYPGTSNGYPESVAVGDVDGDGDADVALTAADAGEVFLWRNLGAGLLGEPLRLGVGFTPGGVVVGEVTGDGRVDLVVKVEPSGAGGWYYPAVVVLEGTPDSWADLGSALAGLYGLPSLVGTGVPKPGAPIHLALDNARESTTTFLVAGASQLYLPLLGGTLVPAPDLILVQKTDAAGAWTKVLNWPDFGFSGFEVSFQAWIIDVSVPEFFSASNALGAKQK